MGTFALFDPALTAAFKYYSYSSCHFFFEMFLRVFESVRQRPTL